MATRLLPRAVLSGLAGVVLLLPFGAHLPGSCLLNVGVAGAAPSPSCGGDLRECLRQSADLRQTTFGGRYVTAEDVARCMEAFRSCIAGGGGGPAPPPSTTAGTGSRQSLPDHFAVSTSYTASDCRISGDKLTCTETMTTPGQGVDTYTSKVTGTVNGLTVTGTASSRLTGHDVGEPSCTYTEDITGPITYTFRPDGTALIRQGPNQRQKTNSGSCSGTDSSTTPLWEDTAKWSEVP